MNCVAFGGVRIYRLCNVCTCGIGCGLMNNKYRICMALVVVLVFGIIALCSLYAMVDMYVDTIDEVHEIERVYSGIEGEYYEAVEQGGLSD